MYKVIYPVIGNQIDLPFYLTGIGINEPEYHVTRENGLTSYQFLITLEGQGVLKVDGKVYFQNVGNCFYLSPSVPHEYFPIDNEWKTAWLVFRGNMLHAIMQSLGFPSFLIYESFDKETFLQIFKEIYTATQDNVNGSKVSSILIYRLILLMSNNFFENQNMRILKKDILKNAIDFIDENFSQDITLEQVSEISGISVQHFCRCFKDTMGMRFIEYLSKRRIAEAKQLLLNTENSISDIALKVGYHGVTYFGMVFRKYEGISPSEFRKTNGLLNL